MAVWENALHGKSRDAVIAFVREQLGCACPDDVFRNISMGTIVVEDDRKVFVQAMNVGNRLLIVLVDGDDEGFGEKVLASVVRHGRQRRDAEGFNRLRVVLAAGNPALLSGIVSPWWREIDDGDEKVHLHVVSRGDVPQW